MLKERVDAFMGAKDGLLRLIYNKHRRSGIGRHREA